MNRPNLSTGFARSIAWLVVVILLLAGLLAPTWILYQSFRPYTGVLFGYRVMIAMTVAFLLPLLATHFYFRRLRGRVRWEIWFGAWLLFGWVAAAWSLDWMLSIDLGKTDYLYDLLQERARRYAVFCFVVWLITSLICSIGWWGLAAICRWWSRRDVKDVEASALVSAHKPRGRKTITLRTVAAWVTLLSIGLSLIFSNGKLAETFWDGVMGRSGSSLWGNSLWTEAALISLSSIVIYCLLNLWLKRFRSRTVGVLALLTVLPAMPLLMPMVIVRQEILDGVAIYQLCWIGFLIPFAVIVWRCALSVVAPRPVVDEKSKRTRGWNWLGIPIVFRWAVVAVNFGWLGLLASIPFTHYWFASGDGSVEVLRHQMVEVYGGDPEQEIDWLDGLNRSLGVALPPEENAIVDLIELRLERLAAIKNANGGMETLREYFQKLGVSSDTVERWLTRLESVEPPSDALGENGFTYETPIVQLVKRQAQLLDTKEGRKWYGLDTMFAGDQNDASAGQATLPSQNVTGNSPKTAKFKIDWADIRKLESDQDIVKAYLAGDIKMVQDLPWRDEDAPLAAKLLKENREHIEKFRQLSRKEHYSPWVRLDVQERRENHLGNDSRRPYNFALALRSRDLGWLEISLMNHAGNEDFEAAVRDLEALARLYDRSWLVEFSMPTWRVDLLNYSARRIRSAAVKLACHPKFPAKHGPALLEVVRSLPTVFDHSSKELINLNANLTADFFQRSEGVPFGCDNDFNYLKDEPVFSFCRTFPLCVDWRPLADLIESTRRKAIQDGEIALSKNAPVLHLRDEKPGPLSDTYFQNLFLTGPAGKGAALTKLLDDTVGIQLIKFRDVPNAAVFDETAICIELYRKREGRYPATLSDLVPAFFATVPKDPKSRTGQGQPYVYRVTKDGYKLYSVGWNGIDDGGNGGGDYAFERPVVDLADFVKKQLRF